MRGHPARVEGLNVVERLGPFMSFSFLINRIGASTKLSLFSFHDSTYNNT
jgi:hypothetical protein